MRNCCAFSNTIRFRIHHPMKNWSEISLVRIPGGSISSAAWCTRYWRRKRLSRCYGCGLITNSRYRGGGATRVVVLRGTRKLLKLLKATADLSDGSDTALGDWYINRIVIDSQPLLLGSLAPLSSFDLPA